MNTKLNNILIPATALLLLSACDSKKPEKEHHDNDEQAELIELPDNVFSFEIYSDTAAYRFKNSAKDTYEQDYKKDLTYIHSVSLVYPTANGNFNISSLQDSIILYALGHEFLNNQSSKDASDTGGSKLEIAAKAWFNTKLKECLGTTTDYEPQPIEHCEEQFDWCDHINGTIKRLTPEQVTFKIAHRGYLGGAHGMYWDYYLTYSIKENKILTLENMLTSKGLKKLPEILSTAAQNSDQALYNYNPEPSNNFYIDDYSDDYSIVFVYDPYEIACYAAGIVEIRVSYWSIKDYLTPLGEAAFH